MDPITTPFIMELNWCFDFRPTNSIIKNLKLSVLGSKKDFRPILMNNPYMKISSITWYIHTGLTQEVINQSYLSANTKNRRETKKLKNKYPFESKVYFNNIPVTDYEENENNSFLWQRLPSNQTKLFKNKSYKEKKNCEEDSENFNTYLKGYQDSEFLLLTLDNTEYKSIYNPMDLTKSANGQFGFVLKAVINGK